MSHVQKVNLDIILFNSKQKEWSSKILKMPHLQFHGFAEHQYLEKIPKRSTFGLPSFKKILLATFSFEGIKMNRFLAHSFHTLLPKTKVLFE